MIELPFLGIFYFLTSRNKVLGCAHTDKYSSKSRNIWILDPRMHDAGCLLWERKLMRHVFRFEFTGRASHRGYDRAQRAIMCVRVCLGAWAAKVWVSERERVASAAAGSARASTVSGGGALAYYLINCFYIMRCVCVCEGHINHLLLLLCGHL